MIGNHRKNTQKNPLTVTIAGANINRDTIGNLKKAGINVLIENNLMSDIVKYVLCSKK